MLGGLISEKIFYLRFKNGSFNFAYRILKETKISNLQNDEELAQFAGSDSENLKTFAIINRLNMHQ